MKTTGLVFGIVFLLFAAVQANDPDPYLWIPIYLFPSVLSFLVWKRKYQPWLYLVGMVAYFAGAIYLFPGDIDRWIQAEEQAKSLEMKVPFIEEARESLGLLIVFIALARYFFYCVQRRKFGIATGK